jgi:hypothetical protein
VYVERGDALNLFDAKQDARERKCLFQAANCQIEIFEAYLLLYHVDCLRFLIHFAMSLVIA